MVPLIVAVSVSSAVASFPDTVTVCVSAPTASCTLTALACSGVTCSAASSLRVNPLAVTTSVYMLGGNWLKVNTPVPEVVC